MKEAELLKSGAMTLGVPLTDEALANLCRFSDELLRVNEYMNLTAITDERQFVIRHLLDSLSLLTTGLLGEGTSIIDVGCGAGFPSMPLKIVLPKLKVTMLDSLSKRIHFLEDAGRLCGVAGARYIHGRAEELGQDHDYREHFDIATARGVTALRALCEYCLPFVKVGGHFLAMKGPDPTEEMADAKNAIGTLGGELAEVKSIPLPESDIVHTIIVIKKISHSLPKYPRSQAKITKSPL